MIDETYVARYERDEKVNRVIALRDEKMALRMLRMRPQLSTDISAYLK
jgi:hypothetical protein